MGMIRLLLASSVVFAHSSTIAGYFGIPSFAAVTCFFIISGFYMGMIGTEKYVGSNRFLPFYSNRFLRLYPTYLIALVFGLSVRLYLAQNEWLNSDGFGRDGRSFFPSGMSVISRGLLTIPNLTLIGTDVTYLFHYGVHSGWHFTFGESMPALGDAQRTSQYLLISPSWSIGLELWFYLLVPFLICYRTASLVVIALLSITLRLLMELSMPWSSYYFFPANLGCFVMGILAYRAYRSAWYKCFATRSRVHVVFWFMLASLVFRQYIPFYRNYSWQLYLLLSVTLPFLFDASKNCSLDRWVGNLSYPVYIIHEPILRFLDRCLGVKGGLAALTATLAFSAVILMLVEQPLDRFRQRRCRMAFNCKAA